MVAYQYKSFYGVSASRFGAEQTNQVWLQNLRRLVNYCQIEVLYLKNVDVGVQRCRGSTEHSHSVYHFLYLFARTA